MVGNSFCIIDAQSVKNTDTAGFVAWLGMRRINGRNLRGKFENRHTYISKVVNQIAF